MTINFYTIGPREKKCFCCWKLAYSNENSGHLRHQKTFFLSGHTFVLGEIFVVILEFFPELASNQYWGTKIN
jgi:hypothetical protein